MNRQRTGILLIALAILAGGFLLVGLRPEPGDGLSVRIGDENFSVEQALTGEARAQGLSGRRALCRTCAMLFVFPEPAQQAFWMRGMRFPLDILWLRGEEIVFIERHVSADSQKVYRPAVTADRVLELNAGAADGVRVGERLGFSEE